MTAPAPAREDRHGERGIALVMAILVLFVITIIATLLMESLSTERKISGHGMRASRALGTAEAGVNEVLSRVATGEIALNEADSVSAAQIFLASAGASPKLGKDSTSLGTLQPSGAWLAYSTSGRSPDALTVSFVRDPDTGAITRYDDTRTPPLNTGTGMPVLQINCTGQEGTALARIVTQVILQPLHPTFDAALTSGVGVTLGSGVAICGYRHDAGMAMGDGAGGRAASPSCQPDEVGFGDVPAVWTGGAVTNNGALLAGSPSSTLEGQPGFFAGPWEAMGLTQAAFTTLLGTPSASPASYNGVVWMDNDNTVGNQSGTFSIAGLSGHGVLYVDGDLTLTGAVKYRGLIYVEGNFASNATGSVIGGLVVHGRAGGSCSLAKGPSILCCPDAVNEELARKAGKFVTLSWRENH